MTNNQIVVSDLFQGPYEHNKRLAEQEILISRLDSHKDDPVIENIIATLQDLTENKIASVVHFESVVDRLKNHVEII